MFGSKASKATEVTVIGRGTVIEGIVRAAGRVQVDGNIQGSLLVEGHVSVGPSGSIVGEVCADELVVGGRLEGKTSTRGHLHVVAGGSVQGQAHYGTLQVDRGGVLDGTTSHGEGDATIQARSETRSETEAARVAPPPPLPAQLRAPAAAT